MSQMSKVLHMAMKSSSLARAVMPNYEPKRLGRESVLFPMRLFAGYRYAFRAFTCRENPTLGTLATS